MLISILADSAACTALAAGAVYAVDTRKVSCLVLKRKKSPPLNQEAAGARMAMTWEPLPSSDPGVWIVRNAITPLISSHDINGVGPAAAGKIGKLCGSST